MDIPPTITSAYVIFIRFGSTMRSTTSTVYAISRSFSAWYPASSHRYDLHYIQQLLWYPASYHLRHIQWYRASYHSSDLRHIQQHPASHSDDKKSVLYDSIAGSEYLNTMQHEAYSVHLQYELVVQEVPHMT